MGAGADGPRSHWQDAPAEPGPRLDGDVAADLCVVGLGGTGLTAIHEALDLGLSVVGIDARGVAAGAAGRNGGLLLAGTRDFFHDAVDRLGAERALAIHRATGREIERIAALTPEAVTVGCGSVRVAHDQDEWDDCQAQRAVMERHGLAVEETSTRLGPGLRFPGDGWCDPYRRCLAMAARARARGATLFEGSPVVEVEGEVARTADGTCRAKRVVVCVDGHLERLLPELEGEVRTARLQMLATAPVAEALVPEPLYHRYGYEYVVQDREGRLALGGFRDLDLEREWTHDATPTDAIQDALEQFLREELVCDAPITHRWAASVGYVDGPLPVLREARGGAIVTGGYSGTGNVIGALTGRAAVHLATGRRGELVDLFEDHLA